MNKGFAVAAFRYSFPLLMAALLGAGCVPPKKMSARMMEEEPHAAHAAHAAESAPAAPADAAPATVAPAASDTYQRLARLEAAAAPFGAFSAANLQMQRSAQRAAASGMVRHEVTMDIAAALKAPAAEAVMQIDAWPAPIAAAEFLGEAAPGQAEATAFVTDKGRAGLKIRTGEGSAAPLRRQLRLYIDLPEKQASVELRMQRYFKKAGGDLLNTLDKPAVNVDAAKKLAADIARESAAGGATALAGVENCAALKGNQREGACYATPAVWQMMKERAAALLGGWTDALTLRPGEAAARVKAEAPAPKVAAPAAAPEPKKAEVPAPSPAPAPAEKAPEPVAAPKAETAQPKPAPVKTEVKKEAPKKAPAKKPEEKRQYNESGQPVYDLSDVLGK